MNAFVCIIIKVIIINFDLFVGHSNKNERLKMAVLFF